MTVPAWLLTLLLSAAATSEAGWQLGPGAQMRFSDAGAPVYVLDCTGPELVVTQFGVTRLVDLQANRPVSDAEGSALPAGASLMALASDRTDANLAPATAVRNARKGWDMTIRLAKNDPALLSLPKADFVSLFTTGFTRAVTLDRNDRKLFAAFVKQCGGE